MALANKLGELEDGDDSRDGVNRSRASLPAALSEVESISLLCTGALRTYNKNAVPWMVYHPRTRTGISLLAFSDMRRRCSEAAVQSRTWV